MTSVAERAPATERTAAASPLAEIAREVARAGIAGLVAGVVVAGLGGRLVMRLAAVVVPASTGSFTENGNQIGAITMDGTIALVIFGGLLGGVAAAIVWVAISSWVPGRGLRRAALAAPIAVALSGVFLIDGANFDFVILQHDPLVVAMLVGLLAVLGFAVAWLDDVLDRWLPRAGSGSPVVTFVYVVMISVGLVFVPVVVGGYVGNPTSLPMGIALVATGIATLAWWGLRLRGFEHPPRNLYLAGRTALVAAVVFGTAVLLPELADALAIV